MGFRTDWNALVARIDGLASGGMFVVQATDAVGSDFYGIINAQLLPTAARIFQALVEFQNAHENALPPAARGALFEFLKKQERFFSDGRAMGFAGLQAMVALLLSIKTEVSYFLADSEFAAHRLVERAFAHLKRSIVVDPELAARWRSAFETHETHCERLGAVHLLGHGLWGFKASAIGGATDLVLGEPLSSTDRIETAAEALVLTEWKRLQDEAALPEMITSARKQAEKYAGGVLGGTELRSYRYIVIVSGRDVQVPADEVQGGVTYRHINVPVIPRAPSAYARSSDGS
ncbi:hypothetical protein [Anaeromyxobacter terrae]|uniref:hypothetical protein n=1 Tax=Anaeromyxobacter terrae TaxID=2925406 RepID=UPI001F58B324|nr:hypothetical protein [Anaeromyxobacter sp. SG22]